MGLFRRHSTVKADPDQLRRWRGRAAELNDAGAMPWQIVLEALKTTGEPEPRDDLDFDSTVMTPLGMHHLEVPDPENTRTLKVFHGQRYGRPVLMSQGNQRSGQRGVLITWINAATPAFSVTASDGRLTVGDTAPALVVDAIRNLTMQPRLWSKLHLMGGPEGVVVQRSVHVAMHPQGWIYDLWLAELLVHLAAYETLPAPDPAATVLPYRLEHAPTW